MKIEKSYLVFIFIVLIVFIVSGSVLAFVPDAPVIKEAIKKKDFIELQWDSVDDAEGYKVYYEIYPIDGPILDDDAGSGIPIMADQTYYETQSIDVGKVTSYNLPAGGFMDQYYIWIVAYNDDGESQATDEITFVYPYIPSPMLNSAEFNETGLALKWKAMHDDLLEHTRYTIKYKKVDDEEYTLIKDLENYEETIEDLEYEQIYYIEIAAELLASDSEHSNRFVVKYPDVLYGDMNSDGYIDTLDSSFLRRYILGHVNTITPPQAANVNRDDAINSLDFVILQSYIRGKRKTFE
ncbi:MAG: dockerin type I domain-containing protein [Bacillota bacterium]